MDRFVLSIPIRPKQRIQCSCNNNNLQFLLLNRGDQWHRIKDLLPGKSGDCGVIAKDNRLFIEAVL